MYELPLNWPRGLQKPSNSKQGPQFIMPPTCRPNTMEFKGVTYFPRHGTVIYAVRIRTRIKNSFFGFQVSSSAIKQLGPNCESYFQKMKILLL